MDENTGQAENVVAAEDSSADTSPVDETTTSSYAETEEQQPSAEAVADETGEEERKPTRAERRIRDLVEENRQLREQSNQLPQFNRPPQNLFEDGREYTAQELEQRVVQAANSIAGIQTKAQLDQYKAEVNLDRDTEVLPTKYPELNDEGDDFIPELVEAIEEDFKARAFRNGYLDPSVRLADVAERHVKAARAAAKKANAQMKNSVASTADTAALRPGGDSKQEKSLENMSYDEIEAQMKQKGKYIRA